MDKFYATIPEWKEQKRRGGEGEKCNCRGGPGNCPADGVCMTEEVVYEATVTAPGVEERRYFGSAATSLKLRVNNHKCDFRNRGRQHSTTLSTHVWSLKDQGLEPDVRYRIVARARAYSPVTRRCGLCVAEKLAIAKGDPRFMLNKRSEIAGKCRHKNKFLLENWTTGKKTPDSRIRDMKIGINHVRMVQNIINDK